ncbi:Sugar phosphate isomerase/epimerase [Abditibacterium utsteinense]|uniref:Sugar phosphate isomerase/epimerase n=1 Tax=Abditibacterium utsteinense TaxID=1960156 RepID=A0A2S8SQG0_9BACT|nr:sugar phosphate isomerase/epimerase family protein [Abditibacterium utsteinense]PQV63026.1 Sugar phosphate isomerase/epimerase [Abditibacterium utsteinense]
MIPTLNQVTAGGGLSLEEYVALAARHGFEAVDLSIDQAHQLGLENVAALLESHRIFPASFGLPVEWRKDEATFRAGLETLPELAKFAQDLDCVRCVTWVLPDGGAPRDQYAKTSTARFVEIGRILADNGVRLGLEFIGPHHFRARPENVWFTDIAGALDVADEVNSHLKSNIVGLLVDCYHWHTAQNSTMDLAAIPLEQIVHVHINDAPAGVAIPDLQDGVRELPGATGAIDITGFLSTLAALGYDGPVAVETFSEKLKKMTPDEAAAQAGAAVKSVFDAAGIKPLRLL